MMELRHLRYFVSVAEALNVSRAAVRLHISQPAVSRQIRDLEHELGLRLFDRVGRRIRLTADGEDLLRRTREVLAHADSLHERARALTRGAGGILRVGAVPQLLQTALAGYLTRYRRAHPGVDVRLTEEGGVRLLELVEHGELHVALGPVLTEAPLACRPLFPIRLVAVISARSQPRRRTTIDLAELADGPLLVLRRGVASRQLFEAACRIAHVQPRIVLESAEPESLLTLAGAGYGIAVLPSTVRAASRRVQMVPILQDGRSLGFWSAVIWDPRRALPVYAESFIEEAAAHLSRTPPGRRFDQVAPPVPRPPVSRTR
jgi:LysR family cyn operon transcriptional activator